MCERQFKEPLDLNRRVRDMRKRFAIGMLALLVSSFLGVVQSNGEPIKLGVMFISSGPLGGYGINGQRAVTMALEEINAAGGLLGRKVEFVFWGH